MSKKKSGLLIAFGAMLGGAVAAGISYYLKLKTIFNLLYRFFPLCQVEETVITNDRTCFFDKITDREYVRLVISLS